MGNWRNRPPRRPYNHHRNPQYDSESPSEFLQDNVPPWEKKFCFVIGSVPWRKVVNTKYLMSCHTNIVNWDDSAVEETFQSAKERFWAQMNGFHCEISLPDPDIYIDKIDWNSEIDLELMKELDRDFFAPVDEPSEVSNKLLRKYKRMRNSSCYCGPSIGTDSNPWEGKNNYNDNNNTQVNNGIPENKENGLSTWNDLVKVESSLEVKAPPGNETVENNNLGRDGNENPWERCNQGFVSRKDNGWGASCDKDWGWNREEWNNSVNCRDSWARSSTQQWREYGGEARRGGRQGGRYDNQRRDYFEFRGSGFQRREGFRQSEFGYRKNSRFRGEENRMSDDWMMTRANNKRRASFE